MTAPGTSVELREEILDLERQRVAAMVSKDLPALAAILGDDLSYTHSGGRTDTKDSFLTLIGNPEQGYDGVDYRDEEVIACGADGAVVRGIAQIRLWRPGGEKISYPVLFVNVFARRAGRWQNVAWQATRLPE
jgi:hypothetical protein